MLCSSQSGQGERPQRLEGQGSIRRLHMELPTNGGFMRSVVNVVCEFCETVPTDEHTSFAFKLAANELVENLVKYSTEDTAQLSLEWLRDDNSDSIICTTVNAATDERLRDADMRLTELRAAVDPIAYYVELAERSLLQPEGSCLGLGRLRAEAGLDVHHQVSGNRLTISVRRTINISHQEGIHESPGTGEQ